MDNMQSTSTDDALPVSTTSIGGFNQRQYGRHCLPKYFLTLKFVVCIALKIIEIVAT